LSEELINEAESSQGLTEATPFELLITPLQNVRGMDYGELRRQNHEAAKTDSKL
jgi:hypothetical protein